MVAQSLIDIPTISDTLFGAAFFVCHMWMNSDASYSPGELETAVISFSFIVEDQKKLMFTGNFSCCGDSITS